MTYYKLNLVVELSSIFVWDNMEIYVEIYWKKKTKIPK